MLAEILIPDIKLLLITAIIVILFFYTRNKKEKYIDPSIREPFKLKLPLTGSLHNLGGMLLDEKHILHVSHWPHEFDETVSLTGVDKVIVNRKISNKNTIEYHNHGDISILSLDEPIDILNHRHLDIVEPVEGEVVTVIRRSRPPYGTYIESIDNKNDTITLAAEGDHGGVFVSGDAGKPWLVRRDGKLCIVSFTSYGKKGTGALLYNYKDKIESTLKRLNAENK